MKEPSFTFHKQERLRYKRAFSFLFSQKTSFRSGFLRFIYTFDIPPDLVHDHLSVAFSVPKRNFRKAVDRNLIKRRMREAYRLNRLELKQHLQEKDIYLAILIVYQERKERSFQHIENRMIKGFAQLLSEK